MRAIKISENTYKKVKEIAEKQRRKMQEVFNRALENYYKITVGNFLSNKE